MKDSRRAAARNLDADRYRRHYAMMLRIRAFAGAALDALVKGLIYGAPHPSIGQEAVQAAGFGAPRAPVSCAPPLEGRLRVTPERIVATARALVQQ